MRRLFNGVSALWMVSLGIVIGAGLYGQVTSWTLPMPDTRRWSVFEQEHNLSWEVFLEDKLTGQARQLTYAFASDRFPALSPDNTRVAFVSWRDGNPEIYVIDLDTNEVQNISNNPETDLLPAWSPDNLLLAFVSERDGNAEIYLADVRHNLLQNLTHSPNHDTSPQWSPDGRQIHYTSFSEDGKHDYLVDVGGLILLRN